MLQYNPSITGSLQVTGSLLVTSNEVVSGSLTVLGGITGAITGSATSASYASSASYAVNASYLDNKSSAEFVSTGSFNSYTASNDAAVNSVAALAASAASGVAILTSKTGSYTTTSSFNSYTSSNDATVSCVSSTATTALAGVGMLTSKTGSYATTGSNTFTNLQYINATTNAQGFITTASLYTDGGLRVSKDSYVSGTAYFNNVVVYGTSSIQYLTSSQVNVGANIINLNTQTPAVRFGGMAVADSGSNPGVTGSMLWDSVNNGWIYARESGSTYSGGALISGPRSSVQGSEQGTTSCYLMAGQGGDHITSSAIYTDSTASCFYGGTSFISSNGDVCFSNVGYVGNTLGVGITPKVGDGKLQLALGTAFTFGNSNSVGADYSWISDGSYNFSSGNAFVMATEKSRPVVLATSGSARMCVGSTGITTFTCQTCAPAFYANVTTGRSFGNDSYGNCFGWISLYNTTGGIQVGMEGCTGGQLITGASANSGIIVGKTGLAVSANNGATNHLNITSAGSIGVNCISPGYRLDVNGTGNFSGDFFVCGNITSNKADSNSVYLGSQIFLSGTYTGIRSGTDHSFNIDTYNGGSVVNAFKIAQSGAATFSSCVVASSGVFTGGGISIPSNSAGNSSTFTFNYTSNAASRTWRLANDYDAYGDFQLQQSTTQTGSSFCKILGFSPAGIAAFSCQICVKERVWVSGTFPGIMLDRSATSAQSDIQWKDAGTSVWSIGTAVAAVGSNLDFYSYGLGNVLKLAPTGEACFRYLVCAQGGIIPGVGGNVLNTYNESISFTPCLYFQGAVTGLSYATRSGFYSRVGNMVIAQMYIQWCKASSATDNLGVYLPVYTANNATPSIGNFFSGNQPSETRPMSMYGSPNSNLAIVLTQGGQGNLANCFANSTLHYWSITMMYLA